MPPARTASRSTRQATARLNNTIRVATRASHTTGGPDPAPRSPPESDPLLSDPNTLEKLTTLADMLPDLQGYEERIQTLDASVQSLRHNIQEEFTSLHSRFDGLSNGLRQDGGPSNQMAYHNMFTGNDSNPSNVLSRWPWLDRATIESIANGEFDINHLPKLHREEGPRNRYVMKASESWQIPLDGSRPELITGRTKLQSAFPDLQSFQSAWFVYLMVRTSYAPERAPGLLAWSERIVYYVQSGLAWPRILSYISAYFQKYQGSRPEAWMDVDAELIAVHFLVPPKPAFTALNKGPARKPGRWDVGPPEICLNWNRPGVGCVTKEKTGLDCERSHVCSICSNKEHKALSCPRRLTPST